VQALQRTGADLYLDPGTRVCGEAKPTVVVRKVWWPASLGEIEADGEGYHSEAHPMNWKITGG